MLGILDMDTLAKRVGFTSDELRRAATRGITRVKLRLIGKRERPIYQAFGLLQKVQKAVQVRLLAPLKLPPYVHGAVRGRSIWTNVQPHIGQRMVVKVDIANFFPSVTEGRVFRLFHEDFACSPSVARLLTQLTTHAGSLPQGAATSTYIGNWVLRPVDERLEALCRRHGLKFTRFIDDIGISGKAAHRFKKHVVRIVRDAGYQVSGKSTVMPSHKQQKLTGAVLNQRATVGRVERRRREALLASILRDGALATAKLRELTVDKLRNSLEGYIRYAGHADPLWTAKLLDRLAQVDWTS